MGIPSVKPKLIDRVVSYFNPVQGARRLQARASLTYFDQTTGSVGGYRAPGQAKRSLRGWLTTNRTADQDTLPLIERLRAGSRDSFMNNPIATAALRRIRTNVVGWGLSMQARIDRKFLGLDDESADKWEATVEREWRLWAESDRCDITRLDDFSRLQQLVFLSEIMNGDVFVVLRETKKNGDVYPLKLQIIEADQVSNPNGRANDNTIAGGIEVDEDGRPRFYHVKKLRYNDMGALGDWVKIPAFGSKTGRKNVLHIMDRERVGQRRGVPLLAPVLDILKNITRLSEAELMGALVASFFTVFVKTETGDTGLAGMYTDNESVLQDPDGTSGRDATTSDDNQFEIGPGVINELGEGQSIDLADSNRPNAAFEPFFVALVKQISASIELPFEQLMLHFQSSYSASRGAILEAWKASRRSRARLTSQFCQPVYNEWLASAVRSGRISAPGFENPLIRKAWSGAAWVGMGMGQIDPLKETKAAGERLRLNLSTYEDEYNAIGGGNWDTAIERRGREERLLSDAGVSGNTSTEPVANNAADDIEDNTSD